MPSVSISIRWPGKETEKLERIRKLAGANRFSQLVYELLNQWLDKQEQLLKANPCGLAYNEPLPLSKHWIDSLTEPTLNQLRDDIYLVESQEILSKLKNAAYIINRESDSRSMQLWKIERSIHK